MRRVYIAGKLNDMAVDYIKNLHRMFKTAEDVRKLGFAVFVPGMDLLLGMQFGNWEYKDYFENSQPWLLASDIVFVSPNSETSHGTQREIETAKAHGIPVIYDIELMKKYAETCQKIEELGNEVTENEQN